MITDPSNFKWHQEIVFFVATLVLCYSLNANDLEIAGETTFNTYCVACHQPGAVGKVGFAPSIRNRDFLALASDEFIRESIKNGRTRTAMVPWPMLTDEQIDGIVAYLRSALVELPTNISVDPTRSYPGDPAKGKESFAIYCAACHGPEGEGYIVGGSGPGIGLDGFLKVASDDYIFQTVKHGRTGSAMKPFMGANGLANLSESEVGDIIAHLRNLQPDVVQAPAHPLVEAKGDPQAGEQHFNINCMACHQQGGLGKSGFAPSIRNRDFLAIASDTFIKETVQKGRLGTSMIGRPDLSNDVLNDIIAYLRAAPIAIPISIEVDPNKKFSGNSVAGHEKFSTYCASCHGPDGGGYVAGGSGPAIGLPGFLSAASDDYIFQTVKHGRLGTAMKPFIGVQGVANLKSEDVFDIIAYLRNKNN